MQEAFSLGLHVPLQGRRNPHTHNHTQPAHRAPAEDAGFSANLQHRRLGAPSLRAPCSTRCLEGAEGRTLFPSLFFLAPMPTSSQLRSGLCFPKVIETYTHTPQMALRPCAPRPKPRPRVFPRNPRAALLDQEAPNSPSPRSGGSRSAAAPQTGWCSWPRSRRSRWGHHGRRPARSCARYTHR